MTFVSAYEQLAIASVAFPQLGCGNGELDWESEIRPLMERYLGKLPIRVYVYLYPPEGPAEHRDRPGMKRWLRAEPTSLGFVEVWNDLESLTGRKGDTIEDAQQTGQNADVVDNRFLAIPGEAGAVRLYFDDLASLWMRLRSFGFLSKADVPDAYAAAGDVIINVFAQLPYVRPVRFSISRELGTDSHFQWTEGVMLMPSSDVELSQKQLDIFSYT